jgi:hypothetical protein
MSPLMDLLAQNASFMPKDGSEKQSACQLQCMPQQQALVACVESIRESGNKSCLHNAVHVWTKCCTEANMATDAEDDLR